MTFKNTSDKIKDDFLNVSIPTVKIELQKHGITWDKQIEKVVYICMSVFHRVTVEVLNQHLRDSGVELYPTAKRVKGDFGK